MLLRADAGALGQPPKNPENQNMKTKRILSSFAVTALAAFTYTENAAPGVFATNGSAQ